MNRWSKVRAVAGFELLSIIRRPGYLIATFGMPVFMLLYGGVISAIGFFIEKKESEVRVYGVIDRTGILELKDEVRQAAMEVPEEIRAALESASESSPLAQAFAFWDNFVFRPFDDFDSAQAGLLEGEIKGIYLLPADYLQSGAVESYAREGPDFEGSESRAALRNLLLDRLLEGRVDADVATRVRKPIADSREWTVKDDGTIEKRSIAAVLAKLLVPVAFTILLFISLMMSAGYLLQGTAQEKENKMVEVLLSSADPDEILTGKLLGLGSAGLLQVLVWFGMLIFAGLVLLGAMQVGGVEIPWFGMITGLFFFLAGYLFLGSLMLGTGSLGSNMRESQQFSMIWTLPTIIPLVFMQILVFEPHGTLGKVLIWIPFTAPVTVILRSTLEPAGIAWWEIGGAFLMMVGATWFAIRLGARLFRVGLLFTGARPKLREILRQARLSA